jgi:O-antigen/teichoic acid export membrane protein
MNCENNQYANNNKIWYFYTRSQIQRFMLSDLKKIFSQSIIYGLGTMAPKLAGLILIPLYTKHFPLSDFGVIGLLDSTSQLIIGILGFSLYQGFFRWYFDKSVESKQKSLFFSLLVLHILIAIFSFGLALIFARQLSLLIFGHIGYAYVLKVMALASLVQMVIIMPTTLMRLQEKAGIFALNNLVQMAVMLVFTVYLIVGRKQGVEAIYHAQLIGQFAGVLLMTRYLRRNICIRIEWKQVGDIVRFCMPLVISSIAVAVLGQADRYIIKSFGQLGDVGLYTLGFRLSNTLNILIVASISFAIQPLIYKKMDDPENKRFYSKLMTYFVFVVMFFVLGMTLFGKEIVKIFSRREEYYEAYRVIPLLTYSILFMMMKDMALIGLQITKKTGIIATVVVIVSLSGLMLNFLLVPLFQNFGAATARLLTGMIFFGLTMYFSQKMYSIPYEIRKLALLILLGVVLYIPAMLVNDLNLLIRMVVKTLCLVSFPLILYPFNFYEKAEITAIRNGWRKWKQPSRIVENFKSLLN